MTTMTQVKTQLSTHGLLPLPIANIFAQTLEVDNKTKLAFTRHDPIGVCGQMWVHHSRLVKSNYSSVFHGIILSTCGLSMAAPPYVITSHRLIPRAWKVAPALAVGCTLVMKPSELTPLTALVRHPPALSYLIRSLNFS